MKIPITWLILLLVVIFSLGAISGYFFSRKDIVVYHKGGYLEMYPKMWPTYNLPLVEYSLVLSYLNANDYDGAKRNLERFIEETKCNAAIRMSVASKEEVIIIKRAIERSNDVFPADPSVNPK